jgi:hypothetical protein
MRAVRSLSENVITVEERIDALIGKLRKSRFRAGARRNRTAATAEECATAGALYEESWFRSHIIMEQYRFGVVITNISTTIAAGPERRTSAYPHLARTRIIGPGAGERRESDILLITLLLKIVTRPARESPPR